MNSFLQEVEKRRSVRVLKKDPRVNREFLEEILKSCLYAPSAFNMQNTRLVMLLDENHLKFWNMVKEILQKQVPEDRFASTEKKLAGFAGGNGTILFYEESETVEEMMKKQPLYKDLFPKWSQQNNAILQFCIWTAFSAEGLGASLQHYNPIVDDAAAQAWNIRKSWNLIAQMPFGKPDETPAEKELKPMKELIIWP